MFIPAGIWTDIFTGDVYNGGKNGKSQILCRNLQSIPVLGRAGAIIPLASECGSNDIINPKKLMWLYVQVHQIHLLCTKILEMDLTTKKANML